MKRRIDDFDDWPARNLGSDFTIFLITAVLLTAATFIR